MSESDKSNLDFVALHHLPSDVPDSFAPVRVLGDGNCFCRAVSYLLFRNESRHAEIRTRIAYEAVNNMAHYLDNSYVQQGANHLYRQGTFTQQCAMYSDNYRPHDTLNVENIYMQEVMDICKNGAYMGVWQIFQVANVIQHPVKLVYPEGGNANV